MEQSILDGDDFGVPNIETERFDLIDELFEAFHINNILYCHWKSNEHLGAGLSGRTDLDLLFDESQKDKVVTLMSEQGFKYFKAAPQKCYDGIEDFIGLDFDSGRIFHLHTHFKLTLGENYIKSYQLNIEPLVLNTRVFDNDFQVYRTHPALELILLFIRASFKIRTRDRLKMLFGKSAGCAPSHIVEYKWLMANCTDSEVQLFLRELFANYTQVHEIIKAGFNKTQLIRLSSIIRKEFGSQRLFHPVAACIKRWKRELSIKLFRHYVKIIKRPCVVKRINPAGGLAIAFVGPDGSGKSTIINRLEHEFRSKLDVYSIYFGKGGGKVSWYRRLFMMLRYRKFVKKGWERELKDNMAFLSATHGVKDKKHRSGKFGSLFFIIEALMVQREKMHNYQMLVKARKMGMLVICDRFPQNQTPGYNDGPSLTGIYSVTNTLLGRLVKSESKTYDFLHQHPPDIVFKLVADVDIIAARKPGETSLQTLRKKQEGYRQLVYPAPCKIIEIDANQPLQFVLSSIRKNIWESLG